VASSNSIFHLGILPLPDRKKEKCKHYRHGLGSDVVLCSAPPNGCRNTQHPTWRIKIGKYFQWGAGGWEAEACTPPKVLLRYLWGL